MSHPVFVGSDERGSVYVVRRSGQLMEMPVADGQARARAIGTGHGRAVVGAMRDGAIHLFTSRAGVV